MKTLLTLSLLMVLPVSAAESLILEKALLGTYEQKQLELSKELPAPNLILERGLVYTPTTRIQQRIISGGTNLPQFRSVPESEYYKGN